MKNKKVITIVISLIVIIVVILGIIFGISYYKKSQSVKIDQDSKDFVSELTSFVKGVDDSANVDDSKNQISEKMVELQKKYSLGNAVSIESLSFLNTLSGTEASSTKDLKQELLDTLDNIGSKVEGLIYKSAVEPQVVTIASSSVCSNYGQDSEYCLDGSSKKLNAYVYINDANSTNWVLLLHGNSMTGRAIYNALGGMYEENNYNVIAPDFRGQGNSDGACAMGYLESLDSFDWIKYVNENYNVKNLVVHGVSLGGATTLQLATNPDFATELRNTYHVKGFVDDCGYTSMTEVLKGFISIGDTSSISATLANVGVKLEEFKDKIVSIFNNFGMSTTKEDINNVFNGSVSLDDLEEKLATEYPTQYETSKETISAISEQVCQGLSYEECMQQTYQYISGQATNGQLTINTPSINLPTQGDISNFAGSFINRRETTTSLVDNVIDKVILDLLNVGLTSENFEKYQNSFSEGRNFNSNDKVLFIHGQSDTFVKASNSVTAEAKAKEVNTKLNYYWKVDGKPHAFIVVGMNKDQYSSLIDKYLECVSNDIKCSDVIA